MLAPIFWVLLALCIAVDLVDDLLPFCLVASSLTCQSRYEPVFCLVAFEDLAVAEGGLCIFELSARVAGLALFLRRLFGAG